MLAVPHAQRRAPTFADLQGVTLDLGASASVDGGKVPLAGGMWRDPADGGSAFALLPLHAIGDVDGDAMADAVVLLRETSAAGTFIYLIALRNDAAGWSQLGEPEWLGQGTVIERLSIDRRGVISVRFLTHKERDRECCPTMRIDDRFRVEGGRLVGITK